MDGKTILWHMDDLLIGTLGASLSRLLRFGRELLSGAEAEYWRFYDCSVLLLDHRERSVKRRA
ncbi:MAG: hypothetical protein HZB35_04690 [Nitrospirae bacterium]|nr:hypothetical protein [Nitrospirota bacterium]